MSFGKKIRDIRERELEALKTYTIWGLAMRLFWGFAPQLVTLSSFAAYTAAGYELTAAKAFTSLALFNELRFPLSFTPIMVVAVIEANVSFNRINRFLSAQEMDPNMIQYDGIRTGKDLDQNGSSPPPGGRTDLLRVTSHSLVGTLSPSPDVGDDDGDGDDGDMANQTVDMDEKEDDSQVGDGSENKQEKDSLIRLEDCTFAWDDHGTEIALSDLNCQFKKGTITMIIGETGSGKSALLRAILGNLAKVKGNLIYDGSVDKIGFSSQVAWIQNATLRDNILFSSEYEEKKYDAVVHACALKDDLAMLSGGDMTEIGEKGINLSGGQKQRVSLARACYSDSDIIIADDPLSAVDTHVANHIFKECFINYLLKNTSNFQRKREKTIILATHAVSFLSYADNIIVMNEGKIQMQGKLADLYSAKINLTKFVLKRRNSDSVSTSEVSAAIAGEVSGAVNGDDDDAEHDKKDNTGEADNGDGNVTKLTKQQLKTKKDKEKEELKKGELVKEEERGVGHISYAVYWSYLRAAGGWIPIISILVWFLIYYATLTSGSFWLAFWADSVGNENSKHDSWYYLQWYAVIQFSSVLGLVIAFVITMFARLRASAVIHESLLENLLFAGYLIVIPF